MMKAFDIALKDMRQSFRNKGAIIFMFVVPILVTGLFYFMFGNIAKDDQEEAFSLPQTAVILVNLDKGQLTLQNETLSMGSMLAAALQNEALADLISLTELDTVEAAKKAVDNQEAGVAIIIPASFTEKMMRGEETAVVELYNDPTLTLGPAIVGTVVNQVVDGMASANIGINITMAQLVAAKVIITPTLVQNVVDAYTAVSPTQPPQLTILQAPPGKEQTNELTQMLSMILGGMMVFYAFFTGSNMLQSVLTEQEKGTLQRLFTTPTPHLTIFTGKFLAALLVLFIQITVLLLFGWLVFDIQWGAPLAVLISAIGLIIISATTGLLLVSFLKSSRQAGAIFGGLLTLTGMIGLFPTFTAGVPNSPKSLETIALFVPQGWAVRGFQQSLAGTLFTDVLLTFSVVLLWSSAFFIIGQRRLQKRFA
jgi:ABC-2 type transport system permease protein